MLSRRHLLAGSATALSVTLAGCSGFLDDGADGTDAATESTGDGTPTDTQDGLTDGEKNILGTYENSLAEINTGEESLESGAEWYDDDRYTKAMEEYQSAVDSFHTAAGKLQTAEDIGADDVGDEVLTMIRDAREYASYRQEQARATEEAVDDELISAPADKIQAHLDDAEEARQKADQIDLKTTAELKSAIESA